jgi:hypothetical protein
MLQVNNVKIVLDFTGSEYNPLFSFPEEGNDLFPSLESKGDS